MLSSRSRYSRQLLALSLLMLLGACAVETPYQPSDGAFGYRDQKIEADRYRVSFNGNELTPRDTVQNYLLYRAAELTLEEGFDYFTIVDRNLERSTRYFSQGFINDFGFDNFSRSRSFRRFPSRSSFTTSSVPVNEYESVADILIAKGEKPKDDPNAYDALDVLQQLKPLIREPEPKAES